MTNMQNPNNGSDKSGSPAGAAPQNGGQAESYDSVLAQKAELEKKLGSQGNELGEYRKFFENVEPLLKKLDESPELVNAIIDGRIDSTLAKAVQEGRFSINEAQVVTKAATDMVKDDLGKQKFDSAKPEDLQKLIGAEVAKLRQEIEESAGLKELEVRTKNFIDSTTDFVDFAADVEKWLEAHPNISDVETAYFAVKGRQSVEAAKRSAEEAAAERAKEMAGNAAVGGFQSYGRVNDASVVDGLIAGRSNPNSFF